MNRSILVSLVIVGVLCASLIWWYGDAQVIKRQSNSLLESLNITGAETRSFKMLKTNTFTNMLAKSVSCRVDMANYRSQFSYDDLEAQHHLFVNNVDTSSIKASNMAIEMLAFNEAKVSAGLSLAVTGKGRERFSENCQLTLLWEKTPDGKWKLTQLEISRAKG